MLKFECPECKEWVHSPLLAQIKETQCPNCTKNVPVQDICISAGPYSIHRDVLLKNFFKYKQLLSEVEKELGEIEQYALGKGSSFNTSSKTVLEFLDSLKELLDGCRDNMRAKPGNTSIECLIGEASHSVKLVNISSTGLCIQLEDNGVFPEKGSKIKLAFSEGGGSDETFTVNGKVMWLNKKAQMGIKFRDLDDRTTGLLQEYILEIAPVGVGREKSA